MIWAVYLSKGISIFNLSTICDNESLAMSQAATLVQAMQGCGHIHSKFFVKEFKDNQYIPQRVMVNEEV